MSKSHHKQQINTSPMTSIPLAHIIKIQFNVFNQFPFPFLWEIRTVIVAELGSLHDRLRYSVLWRVLARHTFVSVYFGGVPAHICESECLLFSKLHLIIIPGNKYFCTQSVSRKFITQQQTTAISISFFLHNSSWKLHRTDRHSNTLRPKHVITRLKSFCGKFWADSFYRSCMQILNKRVGA